MKLCRTYQGKILKPHNPRLLVNKDVIDFIVETTRKYPKVETGGILMGYDLEPWKVHVTHVSLPGPRAFHSKGKFLRDTEYCTRILKENFDKFGVDYVGEWHSHVLPIRGVSGGDIGTILSIMFDPDYDFNAFASIVAVLENNNVELIGYISKQSYIYKVEIEVV